MAWNRVKRIVAVLRDKTTGTENAREFDGMAAVYEFLGNLGAGWTLIEGKALKAERIKADLLIIYYSEITDPTWAGYKGEKHEPELAQ